MLKRLIHLLSIFTILGLFLALMMMPSPSSGVASAQSEEIPLPLGTDCRGVAPLDDDACCAFGYVYYNDEPVADATVRIESAEKTWEGTTGDHGVSDDAHYQVDLTTDLNVAPGDEITITVSYNDMVSTRTWTVQPSSQQVDVGLIEGYQASEARSADTALDESAANVQASGYTAVLAGSSPERDEGQASGYTAVLAGASPDPNDGKVVANLASLSYPDAPAITTGEPDAPNASIAASEVFSITEVKLTASDMKSGDEFGTSVSIDGDVLLVGAPFDDDNASNTGSAYVYRWNGSSWQQEAKLTASDGGSTSEGDRFGHSVSVSGNVALVGAYKTDGSDMRSGAAYVYRWNGESWQEEAKLTASNGSPQESFGYSVSVSGDVALVGAYYDHNNEWQSSGAAYMYRWNGESWQQEARLLASDGSESDHFGYSVSLSGNLALVGAWYNNEGQGAAYVFRWNGSSWQEEAKLLASDGARGDWFGRSVSLNGDVALIGAPYNDDQGFNSGSAYAFRWDGSSWQEEAKLLGSQVSGADYFGSSVSVSGDVLIVGAYRDYDNGAESGSAYLFDWNGSSWQEEVHLLASDGAEDDKFGSSLSLSRNRAIIGTPRDSDNLKGSSVGSAYLYNLSAGSVPDISLSSSHFVHLLSEEENPVRSLTIGNFRGTETLTWSINSSADWLHVTPNSGTVAAGDSQSVSISVYGDNLRGGSLGKLTITSNDPDEASLELPFLLTLRPSESKILASDGASSDRFGDSVSLSGNLALVGAYGSSSGAAYVYRWDGSSWQEDAKLLASDSARSDYFGYSVSLSGDVAIVGAYGDDDNGDLSGSAYIFRWNGESWQQEAKLLASDGAENDRFGHSVSISGNVALVGTDYHSTSAYLFRWDGSSWQEEAHLEASNEEKRFGNSVSVSGDVALVSATQLNNSYVVYVYRWNGESWQQETTLSVSDGQWHGYFGNSASISGDVALIGAYEDHDNGQMSGSAYLFRWDGSSWQEEAKLTPKDGTSDQQFGSSVSISGDLALIGTGRDGVGSQSGKESAYLFRWNGESWEEVSKLTASDGATSDSFGRSVSISGDVALIGALGDDDNGSVSGSAYLYDLSPVSLPAPDIALSPTAFAVSLAEGESTNETLTISNTGTSDLDWQASGSAAWLSVAPTSGTVAPEATQSLAVGIDASGLSAGTYTDTLTITSNDANEGQITVPVTLIVSDYDAPTADFSASTVEGDAPLTGPFIDESTGAITSWTWDFGDGNISGAGYPEHTYWLPGTYTVSLTVSGPGGEDSETKEAYITVNEPPTATTLILTNRQKVEALHGSSSAMQLMSKLGELAAHERVLGLVIAVENEPSVATAYAIWDADPTSTEKANAVTSAIKGVVDAKLASYPDVEYIVVAGDDRVIPFRRVRDKTWYSETRYRYNVSCDSVTGAALCDDMTLTDDYYADHVPFVPRSRGWDGHATYLPDFGIGRLIETPQEMMGQIDTFLGDDGISVSKAAVTGYSFVTDAAAKSCRALNDAGVDTDCTLIQQNWSKNDFISKVLNSPHDVISINGHANHYSIGVPNGARVTSQDIADAPEIHQRAIFYTIACHAGLNVPPSNAYPLDTAQALAQKQANYVGNTGYGYGYRYSVGLSEQLMINFTKQLTGNSAATLGQALVAAKQSYYLHDRRFGYYDEKVLIQSTLYGLPMYQVTSSSSQRAALSDELPEGVIVEEIPIPLDGEFSKTQITFGLPALTEVITDAGTYYSLGGLIDSEHGEPIQPKLPFEVTVPGTNAHGLVFKGGSYSDISGFNPVIAEALTLTLPSTASTLAEPTFTETNWYPAIPSQLNILDNGAKAQLTTLLGQYNSTIEGGSERLYSDISFDVYYHGDSDDWTEPTIASVSSELATDTATVTVSTSDDSGIHDVLVTHTDQNGTWQSLSLTDNGEAWSGTFSATVGFNFFVQVVDKAGNVTVDDNNGAYYQVQSPPSPPGIPLVAGWNLISLPVQPNSTAIADVLASIEGNYSAVYAYNGCDTNDYWKSYDPTVPAFVNDLNTLEVGTGFWVNMTAADTLELSGTEPTSSTKSLCTGWNLVGYPSLDSREITDAVSSIPGAYSVIYAFEAADQNDTWKTYDPSVPDFVNDLKDMNAGFGYWIKANQAVEWEVNN